MSWEVDLRMIKEGDSYKYSEKEHKAKEGRAGIRDAGGLVNSDP